MPSSNSSVNVQLVPRSDVGITAFLARDEARGYYETAYVSGKILTHDGATVLFYTNRFDHAFKRERNGGGSGSKDEWDMLRLLRVEWIGHLIQGCVNGTECYEVSQNGKSKRLYIVDSERYICWLEPSPSCWRFSTAYCAMLYQLKKYRKGAKLIWRR